MKIQNEVDLDDQKAERSTPMKTRSDSQLYETHRSEN